MRQQDRAKPIDRRQPVKPQQGKIVRDKPALSPHTYKTGCRDRCRHHHRQERERQQPASAPCRGAAPAGTRYGKGEGESEQGGQTGLHGGEGRDAQDVAATARRTVTGDRNQRADGRQSKGEQSNGDSETNRRDWPRPPPERYWLSARCHSPTQADLFAATSSGE